MNRSLITTTALAGRRNDEIVRPFSCHGVEVFS